jgi:peptide/nickel transport system substrate-binding protein
MIVTAACGSSGSGGDSDNGGNDGAPASDATGDAGNSGDTGGPGDDGGAKVLRVGVTEDSSSFNPWAGAGGATAMYLVYESIVQREGNGQVITWCAESVDWIDNTTFVVKVRDDVTFSDGDKLTAEDVVYSIDRAMEATQTVPYDPKATTIADDGLTITYTMLEEYGPFKGQLDNFFIVNKSAVEDWGDDDERWWDRPVSTGPYSVVENVSGSHVTLKAREDYWNKDAMPEWDEVIINLYSNPTAMFVAFENDEIDLVAGIDANDAKRLQSGDIANADTTKFEVVPGNANYLLCLNPNKKEFQDIKVREAIANVINRESVGEVAFGGLYQIDDSSVSPGSNYYTSTGSYDKGVDYAKECMAASSYPDGFDMKVSGMSSDAKIWEVLQENLSQLGINLTFETFDLPTYMPMMLEGGITDAALMTSLGGNPTGDPYHELSSFNPTNGPFSDIRLEDGEYKEIWDKGVFSNDEAQRAEYFAKIQQWLYDNIQAIPLVEPSYCFAYNSSKISSCDFYSGSRITLYGCHAV